MDTYGHDYHQEDKDNRAQGLDREPEPPADEPLALEHIEELLQTASGPRREPHHEAAEACDQLIGLAVPQLLDEVRRLRARLAAVEAMPTEHRYAAISTLCPDPDDPDNAVPSAEAALAEVPRWKHGKALRRTVYLGPWEDLAKFAVEAPF
ncbi:hypothetical protein ACFYY8_31800 [Streptosporangium sp. NPDC001559]|uniref:hypothetical protein n=1 Tax=Streptosporangium sp. NPDC001559 TaxID=3366187 RepID=UPI0036EEDD48